MENSNTENLNVENLNSQKSQDKFEILCVGGGSIRGFCELGALFYLESEEIYNMENIHTVIGTSIGSVISLLLVVGYSPMEILTKANRIDKFVDFEATDILNFKEDGGLLNFNSFLKIIETLINQKIKRIPTLKELYELTCKRLIITTTNVSKKCTEYLDYINNPDLNCLDAIKMSCSIPLVFKRVKYNDCYYVDGGLLDNFPIEFVNDFKTKIIGISVESSERETDSFINYIDTLFTLPILKIQNNVIKEKITKNCLVINMIINNTPIIDFNLNKNFKIEMFVNGYEIAKEKYFSWF